MIFYIAIDENGHRQLRGTQADARAVNKQFEQIDIPTDKAGLMDFVQELYAEIDLCTENGEVADRRNWSEPTPPPAPKEESYGAKACRFEDEFDAMPLALQLHYAARAMENVRDFVPGQQALVSSSIKEELVHPGG